MRCTGLSSPRLVELRGKPFRLVGDRVANEYRAPVVGLGRALKGRTRLGSIAAAFGRLKSILRLAMDWLKCPIEDGGIKVVAASEHENRGAHDVLVVHEEVPKLRALLLC